MAQRALAVYHPKGMVIWEYLDRMESAIEIASALDATVLPAAVMCAYLPSAESLRSGNALNLRPRGGVYKVKTTGRDT